MPDPYQELDVFGRPKSRVDGVPYVAFDDDLAALQNYVLNLRAKEEAIESGARTPRRVKEIVREGGRLPGYVHPYEPGYVVQEQERLRDETDPVQFLPIVRQGVENVRAIVNEGFEKPEYIDAKLFGQRAPQYLNTLGSQVRKGGPGFEARFGEWQDPQVIGGDPALHGSLVGRTQMWPEKMARSGASLPGDVMSGRVMTGPGLRSTDFSDIPGAPNPLAPLIERTQDLAGMAMGGSIPELAARGVDRNALGSGFVPKEPLTSELRGGTNVPEATPRNIGRETMPEILARQRASEGYEAAIRDPETKKLYTGMWHEEVLDKIAKDKGISKDQLPTNLVKGYVNDRGRFLTEEAVERMSQNRSKTAMFRADDEVGAAVAAMHAAEGKTPELKIGQADLPAVIPQGGLPAPGTALNPVSNRRGFLRGARDLMAAASNANKIVGMAEKLGQTPIPKNPKVPLKEIWKTEGAEIPEHVREGALENFWDNFRQDFEERHPEYEGGHIPKGKEKAYDRDIKEFEKDHTESIDDMTAEAFADWKGSEGGGTQFSHHQLPGATNYREHLMQMPEREFIGHDTIKRRNEQQPFYGDWDEPDVIGHSRINDRQIPGVGKALHIEEIGSQLHEKGAKEGYKVTKPNGDWEIQHEGKRIIGKEAAERNKLNYDVPPDLPFKKTYVDLAVNRMLHEAATQGYDAVSWTPHELQKKNYGGDSNKEILPRIEALAKKYGGKIEKHKVEMEVDKDGKPVTEDVYHVKLTPEMKRIFGHEDFSFFPKQEAAGEAGKGFKLRSDSEAGAAIGALRNSVAFKNWFGDSKIVDKKGEPLVVYHGTKSDFNTFEKTGVSDEGLAGKGFYFTSNPEEASGHALNPQFGKGTSPNVIPAFVSIKNPLVIKRGMLPDGRKLSEVNGRPITSEGGNKIKKLAEDNGHDGVVFADADGTVRHAVVWDAKKIKSTTGNNGKFDYKSSNILHSDDQAGAAIGALRNSVAPTFYSGLSRTIERAPFETATPSQWMKHLRDTVGARQAEEFEHVGLEGRLGPLAEVKTPVERKAQAALEEWKAANKGQRPPKELTDAASNENKRIVEQRLAEKGNEKPLTKAELLAHVAGNQPKFKEIVKGKSQDETEAAIHERAQEFMDENHPEITPAHRDYQDYFADAVHEAETEMQHDTSKYFDYQLLGGTNYREHLMTMPPDWHYPGRKGAPSQAARENTHYSSHWDEPNVIVHTRMNDRMLGDPAIESGVRSLHAEEFQSDLHQEGRKRGYKTNRPEEPVKRKLTAEEARRIGLKEGDEQYVVERNGQIIGSGDTPQEAKKYAATATPAVPNFPFKKSWPDLAIKRWLREAADNDYDAVSWTPGEAQRDRFQLGHHVENLTYHKLPHGDVYVMHAERRDGREQAINRGLPIEGKDLSSYVGDAIADKIKKGEGTANELDNVKTLHNADLKVGGEGLVSFYDKTIKGKVEALVEKFGGKVEKHEGGPKYTGPSVEKLRKELKELTQSYRDDAGMEYHQKYQELYDKLGEAKKAEEQAKNSQPVWVVKLTPEMKRAIRSEGFPLFTAGPVMTPVDHDPFDKKQKPKPKLEPVEHDPFAQPTPDLGGTLNKLISTTGGYRPRPRPIQNGFGRRQ